MAEDAEEGQPDPVTASEPDIPSDRPSESAADDTPG